MEVSAEGFADQVVVVALSGSWLALVLVIRMPSAC